MARLTEEQWRTVLELSDAAADLPPQARQAFLDASGEPAEIVAEALLLINDFGPQAEAPNRVGSSIGRFLVTDYCGSGGVGDVYKANDTELDRTVALKFLRPVALEQSGAVERFIREARTVSALNHANIVTVHEVLRSGQELAIVMEFVEGVPLRTLCQAPLALAQVSAIGRQIARALAAAHQRGIVHRDIKPENAILRSDGSVKVLDFGLATSLSVRRESNADAISASHLFAGTWRYMSPEQSRGEPVTPATDIFSLGLVLHELVTGRRPVDDLARLSSSGVNGRPASPLLPGYGTLPPRFRPLLRSMLSEAASERPSAASVADRLADIERSLHSRRPRLSLLAAFITGVIVLSTLLYLSFQNSTFQNANQPTLLASTISVEPGYKFSLDLSPKGERIAYAWDREGLPRQIYVQSINQQTGTASPPVRLTQSRSAEDSPAWSPNGRRIAFNRKRSAGDVWEIVLRDLLSGREQVLTDFAGRSLIWTRDGKWLLASSGNYLNHSVVLLSPETGASYPLTVTDGELNDDRPTSTFDDRSVIFARFSSDSTSRLATVPLRLNSPVPIQPSFLSWPGFEARFVRNPVYSKDGSALFFVADVDGIRRLYRSRSGRTPALLASLGERIDEFAIAAQRNRMAFSRNLDDTNIWRLQLKTADSSAAGRITRVIASLRSDQRPAVSPDGLRVAFESDRGGFTEIWLTNLTTGETVPRTDLKSLAGSPRWSPDGRWILFDGRIDRSSSLFKLEVSGGLPKRLTTAAESSDGLPVVSPDGRWIYFTSNRAGRYQIWRIPFSGGSAELQTEAEATAPEVSLDGRFLYYLEKVWLPSRLWRKDLITGQISLIAEQVIYRGYVVGKDAVYFGRLDGGDLKLLSSTLDGRHVRMVALMPPNTVGGFSLDPSESTLYFAKLDSSGDEIMLVNSF